jgi:hypothetical protein
MRSAADELHSAALRVDSADERTVFPKPAYSNMQCAHFLMPLPNLS